MSNENDSANSEGSQAIDSMSKPLMDKLEENVRERGQATDGLDEMFEEVEKLLSAFSKGDIEAAEHAIESIATLGERKIFSEVGKITRNLHDALGGFKNIVDPRLKSLTQEEMPEASDKLQFVIEKTSDSAHKTMNIAEKYMSLQSEMSKRLVDVENELAGKMSDSIGESIAFVKENLAEMNNGLMDIMLAQEYQDITGQILRKVMALISELELELVDLVRIFGSKVEAQKSSDELSGPQIKDSEDVLANQDDVDSLLSDLGF